MPTPDAATDLASPRVHHARARRPARETRLDGATASRRRPEPRLSAPRLSPAWTLPGVVWLAAVALAGAQADPTEAAEGRFLALLAAGVLAAIVALERQHARPRLGASAVAGLGTLGVLWVLHHGAHRGTAVTMVLAAGLGWALAGAVRTRGATSAVAVPTALGLQLLLRPDLLLPPWVDLRTVVSVVALPVVVGLAVATLAAVCGTRRAMLAAALVATLAPGWNVFVTATWIVVALVVPFVGLARPRWAWARIVVGSGLAVAGAWFAGDLQGAAAGVVLLALGAPERGELAAWLHRGAAGLLAAVVVLAAYPWCRVDPLRSIVGAADVAWLAGLVAVAVGLLAVERLGSPTARRLALGAASVALAVGAASLLPRPIEVSFAGPPPRMLGQDAIDLELDPATRVVILDTDLVHGDQLDDGAAVARVFLLGADRREKGLWPLRAGRHTADWAAGRVDLAGLSAPEPWLRRLAPSGEFFAQRYRFRVELGEVIEPGDRLVIRRVPRLDPKVRVRVHRVELHR